MNEQVLFGIAMEMDLPDLLNFCLLSKKTQRICQKNYFWRRKLQRDFPVEYAQLPPGNQNYRQIYMGL